VRLWRKLYIKFIYKGVTMFIWMWER